VILTVTMNPCVDKTIYVRGHQPHRVHRSERVTRVAGGKGVNAARIIRKLGGTVVGLVVVGGHTGRHILDMMSDEAIPTIPVWVEGESRAVVTILEADSDEYAQTAYVEPGAPIGPAARVRLFQHFGSLLDTVSLVLLTGPAPDATSTDIYAEMTRMARARGLPVFLDSRGGAFVEAVREGPTLVKPNEAEAAELLGVASLAESQHREVLARLHAQGTRWVVLTLGRKGALVSHDGQVCRALAPAIETVNPIASGDVMLGAMATAWERGDTPENMIRLGIAAGAANAATWDAGGCSASQILELVEKVELLRV
jgi:1-phosphofructokinase family hexose kinase